MGERGEAKHLPGRHDQRTHGHRYGLHNPARLLLRTLPSAGLPPARRTAAPAEPVAPSRPARPAGAPRPSAGPARAAARRARSVPAKPAGIAPEPAGVAQLPDNFTAADLARIPLHDASDADIASALGRTHDVEAVERLCAELDRRDDIEPKLRQHAGDKPGNPAREAGAMDALANLDPAVLEQIANPARDVPRSKARTKTVREQARDAYEDYHYVQYLAAEEACNGYLLSKAGKAAGINPALLFTGAIRRDLVKKYASEELLRWFADNPLGRLTFGEFLWQYTGWDSLRDANRTRRGSSLSEFG